jgi:hypothetical protein
MSLELDPEEERALAAELRRLIADDRYPLSRLPDSALSLRCVAAKDGAPPNPAGSEPASKVS